MVDLSNWMEECRQIAETNKDLPQWQRAANDRARSDELANALNNPAIIKRLEAIEHRLLGLELALSVISGSESRPSSATETR